MNNFFSVSIYSNIAWEDQLILKSCLSFFFNSHLTGCCVICWPSLAILPQGSREASTLCHLSLLAGALSCVPKGSQAGEQWTEVKSRCQACSFLLRKEVTVVLNAQVPDCIRWPCSSGHSYLVRKPGSYPERANTCLDIRKTNGFWGYLGERRVHFWCSIQDGL